MNITYKIENYYPAERRAFVVYQNGDLPPMGEWVYITPTMTQDEIKAAVVAATPLYKWENVSNTNIDTLLGVRTEAVYVAPVELVIAEPAPVNLENQVRNRRNSLLRQSDWTQLADVNLTEQEKAAWQVYRQALRDVTAQSGFPENVEWPSIL
jgi:hypothetical protein